MSKMGQLNFVLQEQAEELGFETVQEALDNGYEVDYEKQVLIDPQEAAHEAWLKEKEEILQKLQKLQRIADFYEGIDVAMGRIELPPIVSTPELADTAKKAIEFIEGVRSE